MEVGVYGFWSGVESSEIQKRKCIYLKKITASTVAVDVNPSLNDKLRKRVREVGKQRPRSVGINLSKSLFNIRSYIYFDLVL